MENEIKTETPKVEETSTPLIDDAKAAAKEIREATDALRLENDRKEKLEQVKALSGTADAGQEKPEEVPISDAEYSEKLARGEVNPLEEDGFI